MAPQRGAAGGGPPGDGGTEDAGSPVTRTGTSGTGSGRATERAPALSRPQVNKPGRGGALVTRWAHEQGADDARQGEAAAKRTREAHADALEHGKGCEDKEGTVKYVPRGTLGRVNGTLRPGRRCGAASTPPAKITAHVGRANCGTGGDRQLRGAGRRGTRRQGWALEIDAMYAERCPAQRGRSQASRLQRRPRRHCGPYGGTGRQGWWG